MSNQRSQSCPPSGGHFGSVDFLQNSTFVMLLENHSRSALLHHPHDTLHFSEGLHCQRPNGWVCCDADGYEQSLPTAGSNTTKQDCVVYLELATICLQVCGRIASLTLCTIPGLEAPAPAPFTCTRFVVKPRGRTGSYPMAGLAKHRHQRLARHRRQLLAKHSAPFWCQLTRGIRLCSQ